MLLWQARAAGAGCGGWEEVPQVFAPFRNALAEVVGFQGRHRGHPVLGSVGAYEVAYWRLHHAVAGLLPQPPIDVLDDGEAAAACLQSRRASTAREPEAALQGLVEVH